MTLPNQLTILRIVLTPIIVFLLLLQDVAATFIASGVFIIASLTDWYDGHFARKYGYVSDWGKFLDPLADKILILSLLLCFVLLKYVKLGFVLAIVLRDVIITALRAYMMVYDKPIAANFLGKVKTFSQVGLVYTTLIYINMELIVNPAVLQGTLGFMPVFIDRFAEYVTYFTVLTGLVYLYENRGPVGELSVKVFQLAWYPVSLIIDAKPENGNPENTIPPVNSSKKKPEKTLSEKKKDEKGNTDSNSE